MTTDPLRVALERIAAAGCSDYGGFTCIDVNDPGPCHPCIARTALDTTTEVTFPPDADWAKTVSISKVDTPKHRKEQR